MVVFDWQLVWFVCWRVTRWLEQWTVRGRDILSVYWTCWTCCGCSWQSPSVTCSLISASTLTSLSLWHPPLHHPPPSRWRTSCWFTARSVCWSSYIVVCIELFVFARCRLLDVHLVVNREWNLRRWHRQQQQTGRDGILFEAFIKDWYF